MNKVPGKFYNGLLLHPGADDGQGGGGGAEDKPASISESRVNEIVNSAIAKLTKNMEKKLQDTIVTAVTGDESPIIKSISEIKNQVEDMKKTSGKKDKDNKSKDTSDDDDLPSQYKEKFESMSKTIERLTKENAEKTAKEKAAAEKQLNDSRKAKLKDYLEKAGFGDRAKFVLPAHWSEIKWEDDGTELGKPIIKNEKGEEIPYFDFVEKEFVNSDDGKNMLKVTPRFGTDSGSGNRSQSMEESEPIGTVDEIMKEFNDLKGS